MTYQEQLENWVAGKSVHTDDGICCPDFSCCCPENAASQEERDAFLKAHGAGDEATMNALLFGFLSSAVSRMGKQAYITGLKVGEA